MSNKNYDKLKEFLLWVKGNKSRKKSTLETYENGVKFLFKITNKDYNKLTKKDILKVMASDKISEISLELYKSKIKYFLEFINKKDLCKEITFKPNLWDQCSKYDDSDVPNPKDIIKLVNTPNNLYDKAFLEILFASGGRKTEIRKLRYKDIKFADDGIIWINVITKEGNKTGKRNIPLFYDDSKEFSLPLDYLKQFYYNHPFKDNKDSVFFYSTSNDPKYKGKIMSRNTPNTKLKKYCKEAKIDEIKPHQLRHIAATYDGNHFSPNLMRVKYGWSNNSKQMMRYCHTTEKMLANEMKRQAGIDNQEIKKKSICRHCGKQIHFNDKICPHCNKILDPKELEKKIIEQRKQINEYKEMKKKIPQLENEICSLKEYNKNLEKYDKNNTQQIKNLKDEINKINQSLKMIATTNTFLNQSETKEKLSEQLKESKKKKKHMDYNEFIKSDFFKLFAETYKKYLNQIEK